VPKKVRWLARRSAYNARAQEERLFLVESLQMDAPRTKQIVGMLLGAEVVGNVLVLTDGNRPDVWKSARNLQGVQVHALRRGVGLRRPLVRTPSSSRRPRSSAPRRWPMRSARQVIIRPVVTERSTTLGDEHDAFTFIVAEDANKIEIKRAVESCST
jgi:ribosomal protein L4